MDWLHAALTLGAKDEGTPLLCAFAARREKEMGRHTDDGFETFMEIPSLLYLIPLSFLSQAYLVLIGKETSLTGGKEIIKNSSNLLQPTLFAP